MLRFLLDANLSPSIVTRLRQQLEIDVISLIDEGLGFLSDNEVVSYARAEHRIIITLDEDFGEIYYRRERNAIGVIFLRLKDQSALPVSKRLTTFLRDEASGIDLERSLVVLSENKCRVVSRF